MSESNANEILRKRAIALANRQVKKDPIADAKQFLLFQIGNSVYGIEASFVMKVIQNPVLFPLPNTPLFIQGIINENGKIICVNDGHLLFGFEETVSDRPVEMILLQYKEIEFALIVDEILGMEVLSPLQSDTSFFESSKLKVITYGLTPNNVVLLNAKELFALQGLIVNQNSVIPQP